MTISTVTSETLQLKLRQLLPSQQGFGTDITASDTIIPVIDLTASAEGSDVRQDLQTALAFGSQTVFSINATTTTLANSPGFWRVFLNVTNEPRTTGAATAASLSLTDGLSTKIIWATRSNSTTSDTPNVQNLDFVVFLGVGESITATSAVSESYVQGTVRQIATANGTLVQPSGFTPQ